MLIQDLTNQGITRLWTRRDRLRAAIKLLLGLLAAVVCLYLGEGIASMFAGDGWHTPSVTARPLFTGHGGLIGAATGKSGSTSRVQFPLLVHLPAPLRWAAMVALPLWLVCWALMFRVLWRPAGPHRPGTKGWPPPATSGPNLGSGRSAGPECSPCPAAPRSGGGSCPPAASGTGSAGPPNPGSGRMGLWVNFEQRVRIIAGTGWGKSWRLLIPIIRSLPGPAVIASIEAEIFTATVTARTRRRPPGRFLWQRLIARPVEYPVAVIDMSSPEARFASGYPQVRWNPIVGCENFKIATRRAKALIAGGDTDGQSDSSTDAFFRDCAAQVLAAWLHAAAFDPAKDIDDIAEWLRDTDLNTPTSILAQHPTQADQTAMMNMNVHLDAAGGRTTSGVRRYLNFAVSSLASGQGRELCGDRHGEQFDMGALILAGGTLYLLAEQEEMELARPLLSLFAQEMFMAAERTAQTLPTRRHPQTFMGVLDELKNGVRVPILPHVASAQRKYRHQLHLRHPNRRRRGGALRQTRRRDHPQTGRHLHHRRLRQRDRPGNFRPGREIRRRHRRPRQRRTPLRTPAVRGHPEHLRPAGTRRRAQRRPGPRPAAVPGLHRPGRPPPRHPPPDPRRTPTGRNVRHPAPSPGPGRRGCPPNTAQPNRRRRRRPGLNWASPPIQSHSPSRSMP